MALYKLGNLLQHSDHVLFDNLHAPGAAAPQPGIYRCIACGEEIAIARGHTLPPQNHAQHDPAKGVIRWKLLVMPIQRP